MLTSFAIFSNLLFHPPESYVQLSVHNGADSFGSISTGHLLHYTEDRLNLSRLILFSETEDERERHLTILTELHREDFKQIFNEANGKPICIKLLDKSLSELVPFDDQHATQIAQMMFKSCAQVLQYYPN
jgi:phosphoenolpyruvate synthase/pyruvate phosphate dikinase